MSSKELKIEIVGFVFLALFQVLEAMVPGY